MAKKLSEKIYESIRNDIIEGILESKVFISESEIAKKFGVSKAPVRDALHLLCQQGYLISYPRKGYMVNTYTNDEINQIQEVRIHLEKLSIELAIKNATDDEILSLKSYTKEQSDEIDPYKTNNTLFHMRLAEISKNKFISKTLKDLLGVVSQAKIKIESDLKSHDKIIDALLERDLEKSIQLLEEDIKFI